MRRTVKTFETGWNEEDNWCSAENRLQDWLDKNIKSKILAMSAGCQDSIVIIVEVYNENSKSNRYALRS